MKRIFNCLLTVILLVSCSNSDETAPEKKELQDTTVVYSEATDTSSSSSPVLSDDFQDRPSTDELLESFEYCRDNSESSLTCKYFIAKAICLYYEISDFEKTDGTYMDFEEILPAIQSSSNWYRAGDASDQSTLDNALKAVRNGKAALAISERELYGHVVLILPGNTETAISWNGLKVPQVASFFMVPGRESFVDKSIAYAWKTPDGIGVYIRK